MRLYVDHSTQPANISVTRRRSDLPRPSSRTSGGGCGRRTTHYDDEQTTARVTVVDTGRSISAASATPACHVALVSFNPLLGGTLRAPSCELGIQKDELCDIGIVGL